MRNERSFVPERGKGPGSPRVPPGFPPGSPGPGEPRLPSQSGAAPLSARLSRAGLIVRKSCLPLTENIAQESKEPERRQVRGRGRWKSSIPGHTPAASRRSRPRSRSQVSPGVQRHRPDNPACPQNQTKSTKHSSSHSALPLHPHSHALYLFLCRVFNKFLPKGAMIPAA